jgi:hypothetical protein
LNALVVNLFQLLRLRAGPQDLPAAWSLTVVLLALHVGLGLYSSQVLSDDDAVFSSLAINVMQVVAVAAMLHVRRVPERLAQTLSALAGSGLILGVIAHLLLLQADPEVNQPVLGLAWFAIFIWSLVVDAHIYRHALATTMSIGMLVAVLLLAVSYVFVEVAF